MIQKINSYILLLVPQECPTGNTLGGHKSRCLATSLIGLTSYAALLSFILLSIQLFLAAPLFASTEITVESLAERQEVFVGEPFAFVIRINGTNTAEEPDLSHLQNFKIQPRGGQGNSSTQVSNVNGSWQRVTSLTYTFTYVLTPQQAGRLPIPPISIKVDGKPYQTDPLTIVAKKPQETDDFKLRTFLSSSKCYVGEPVTMTTTWFVGKDVNNFDFNVPILSDPRFDVIPSSQGAGSSAQNTIKIPVGDDTLLAEKKQGELGGKEFLTVTFNHLLVPKKAGQFSLPQATVSCQVTTGYRNRRRRSPFGGFDDFFNSGREPVLQTLVVPANEPNLSVSPLPVKNKPMDFSGLVGNYAISAVAAPTEVNIGDPITLIVTIAGPNAANASLPALSTFLPPSSFKIPEEIAPEEVHGASRQFTQTIRVKAAKVHEIPAIELIYFDTKKGSYQTSKSAPIPLIVHATKVVTAMDAEGTDPATGQTKLEAAQKGLAFNFAEQELLIDQRAQSTGQGKWWLLIASPPLLFSLLAGFTYFLRRKNRNPDKRRSKMAAGQFNKTVSGEPLPAGMLSGALNEYLGAKLVRNPGSLTFQDVEPDLRTIGVDDETLMGLADLLEQCETSQFAGLGIASDASEEMKKKARQIIEKLESYFA